MLDVLLALLRSLLSALRGNRKLALENLALRHQLMVVQRQVKRTRLSNADRALWVLLRKLWPDWDKALILVKPTTVIKWHRAGFRAYWRFKSRSRGGRPRVDPETRQLIRRLWLDNPTWGAPHVQAELAKLGILVSEATVRKYKSRARRPPVADLADILEEPRQPDRCYRLLRRAHHHLPFDLCLHRHEP